MPTELHLLVYVCSKFDCFHEQPEDVAEQHWQFLMDRAKRKAVLLLTKEDRKSEEIKEATRQAVAAQFEERKKADVDTYIKAFRNFKLLGELPKCRDDGKLFLDFASSVLNITPSNCKLMCSQDDYNFIASKFKRWQTQSD